MASIRIILLASSALIAATGVGAGDGADGRHRADRCRRHRRAAGRDRRHRHHPARAQDRHQPVDQQRQRRNHRPDRAAVGRRPDPLHPRHPLRGVGRRGQCQYLGARPAGRLGRRQVRPVPGGRHPRPAVRRHRVRHRRHLRQGRQQHRPRRGSARRLGVDGDVERARRDPQFHHQGRHGRGRLGRYRPRHRLRPHPARLRLWRASRRRLEVPRRRLLSLWQGGQGQRPDHRERRPVQGQPDPHLRRRLHPLRRQVPRRPRAGLPAGAGGDHPQRGRRQLQLDPRLRPQVRRAAVAGVQQPVVARRQRQPHHRPPRRGVSHASPRRSAPRPSSTSAAASTSTTSSATPSTRASSSAPIRRTSTPRPTSPPASAGPARR